MEVLKLEKEKKRLYFIFALIFSTAGAILLLITDFAGYYWYSYYGPSEGWVWIYADASVLSFIIFFMAASLLFFCTFVSLSVILRLGGKEIAAPVEEEKLINYGVIACYILGTICIVGALTVAIIAWTEDVAWVDVWLSAGFFGGLIGSGVTAFLFKHYQFRLEKEG